MLEKFSFGIMRHQDVRFLSITDSRQTVVLNRHQWIQKKSWTYLKLVEIDIRRVVFRPENIILLLSYFWIKSHFLWQSSDLWFKGLFRVSSYLNQLKIKVILEYGRNFSFIKHFIEFLGGRETTVVFQEMQSVSTSYILKTSSVS